MDARQAVERLRRIPAEQIGTLEYRAELAAIAWHVIHGQVDLSNNVDAHELHMLLKPAHNPEEMGELLRQAVLTMEGSKSN